MDRAQEENAQPAQRKKQKRGEGGEKERRKRAKERKENEKGQTRQGKREEESQGWEGEKKKWRRKRQERKNRVGHTQTKFSDNPQTSCLENRRGNAGNDKIGECFSLQNGSKYTLATLNSRFPHSGHPNDRIARSARRGKEGARISEAGGITATRCGRRSERGPFLEGIRKIRTSGAEGEDTVRAKRRGQLPLLIIPIKERFAVNQINTFNPISKERRRAATPLITVFPGPKKGTTKGITLFPAAQPPHKRHEISHALSEQGEKR